MDALAIRMRSYVCKGRSKRNESSSKRLAAHTYFDQDCDIVTKQFGPAVHKPTISTNEDDKLPCNLNGT
jgi:hypothetical protein